MDRVNVAEAAKRLGVSQDAIYKRIKRGTIPWDKDEDGKTVVYVAEVDASTDDYGTSTGESAEGPKTSNDAAGESSTDVLVDELRDRVGFLEEELRRKDTILMSLVQRVPELEAPPERREPPVTASEGESGTSGRTDDTTEPRRSWWRRLFEG
jgi:excisionase family DNA binding protein